MTRQFSFTIENCRGDRASFRGDGETILDAFKDGTKNVDTVFRPSSSGKATSTHDLMVFLREGGTKKMTLSEFTSAALEGQWKVNPDWIDADPAKTGLYLHLCGLESHNEKIKIEDPEF